MAEETKKKRAGRPKKNEESKPAHKPKTKAPEPKEDVVPVAEAEKLSQRVNELEAELKKASKAKEVVKTVVETVIKNVENPLNTKLVEENDTLKQHNEKLQHKLNTAKVHYSFIARYDNIQLETITLNNLKCIIFECDANSREEAMRMFDAHIMSGGVPANQVDVIKSRIFGGRMTIETAKVLETDVVVGTLQ